MKPVLLIDVVGLTPRLIDAHTPHLARLGRDGAQAAMTTVLPAVTCSAQATLLTGRTPAEHGAVGNGWFDRASGEIALWRQSNALVAGPKIYETARALDPSFTCAKIFWWWNLGARVDWSITPRPYYPSDGRKIPATYAAPRGYGEDLERALGPFPFFDFWGPKSGLRSSRWLADAAIRTLTAPTPTLTLVYLPHLDYDFQRFGPDHPRAKKAVREVDVLVGDLVQAAERAGAEVVVVSEYGITAVDRPVDVNRALRADGLLEVYRQDGMEYLDPWTSRAFAVADHQIAHVYVRDPADVPAVAKLCAGLPGVAEVLDADGRAAYGLDHERSGELVLVAEPDAWFTYYYWLDDERAPDFARQVEIHRKPGYDPAELFMDPEDKLVKARAGAALVRKKIGMRYVMSVVPLDPSPVRGTHGRLPASAVDAPVFLCSDPSVARDRIAATDVRDVLLELAGVTVPAT